MLQTRSLVYLLLLLLFRNGGNKYVDIKYE